ncbi:MAG: MFS transporter [Gammaproteobacteria bacterium]|nr:MFS transporter [Gammaproteobacteria bacterium]
MIQDKNTLAASEPWIVRNGVGIQIMETLAVGAFLTALAVELGASNLMIGVLAAIPHFAQLAQVPALFVVDRVRVRRRVYQIAGLIARPMLLVIAAAALLPDPQLALLVIAAAFTLRYVAGAFLACAWSSWMRDLVPDNEMGRVFSNRQKSMIGIGIIFSLAAAGFVDAWQTLTPYPRTWGFAVIYTLAFFGGAYSVWAARHIHEPEMAPSTEAVHWFTKLKLPFRDANYRRLIVFLASWNFAINLATPFFTVHMLKKMELDLLWVIGFGTLAQIAAYFMVSQWGAIADRFNNKSVMRVCGPLFVVALFAWTFTTMPDVHRFTIPLLIAIHIATGIASAGINLASSNLTLRLAPQGNATTFLATSSLVNATAAAIAAMIGGLTADMLALWELTLELSWRSPTRALEMDALNFTHWDFFFGIATLIGLLSLRFLRNVQEVGEAGERTVLNAIAVNFGDRVRSLTTIGKLQPTPEFPIDAVEDDLEAKPADEDSGDKNER